MSYQHFTIEERCCLREFYKSKIFLKSVALLLTIHYSTWKMSQKIRGSGEE